MALTAEELKAIQEQSVPYAPPAAERPAAPAGGQALYATPGQKATAVATGVGQGITTAGPMAAGAVTGLKLGTAAAPVLGPFAPAGPIVGGLAGLGAGAMFGEALDKLIWDDLIAAQRPEVAPFREGGKTFGQSIAFAPAAFGLPIMTGNRVSRFISTMGEAARRSPLTYLAGETAAGGAAGVAGGTVYAIDPNATMTRMGAEVGAGLLMPTRLLSGAVSTVKNALGTQLTPTGRQMSMEGRAAAQLREILDRHGEDIPSLIAELQRPIPGSVPTPTAAQKTGRLVLSELETALGNMHVKFGADTEAQGREALRAYSLLVDRLRKVGSPEALTQAAQLRSTLFDQMLDARLATADANAARKVMRISRDTPQARAEIGEIVKFETSLALQNARDVEKMLWTEALNQVTRPVVKQTTEKVPMEGIEAKRIFDRTGIWPQISLPKTTIEAPKLVASNTYDAFLKRASEVGSAVYDKVVPSTIRDIMQDLGGTKASVLAYKAGKATQQFLDTGKPPMGASYKPREVDVGELINYRSNLLDLARDAASRGEASDASWYSMLADSMLQDLNQLKSPMFDAARDFSRSLNDTFTRTFANTASVQGTATRAGAERLPAEILVARAFGRNADVTAQRMTEIEEAVGFMRTQYDQAVQRFGANSDQAQLLKPLAEMADQSVVSIQDAQSRVLRLAASKTIDPITNRVNPKALQAFVNENRPMLDKLGITSDLTDAVSAELALKLVANQNSKLNTTLRNQTMFAQVLKAGENPTMAVTDVLNSSKPVLGMNHLIRLARANGPAAEQGLKSTLIDYAITKAGGMERFDPAAFRDALFKPLGPNKPSIVALLRQHKLMDSSEVKNINELIKPMLRIEDAIANKRSLDDVVRGADAVTEFAMRVVGAQIGGTVAPSGPGSLITASAGSKVVRQIFDKMPTMMTRAMLEQAMLDPALMAMLLQRPGTGGSAVAYARDLAARLAASGVVPASLVNAIQESPEEQKPRPTAAELLRSMPAAPPTRGVPQMPAAPGSAPGAGGKISQSPQGMSMYEALFPNDSIGAMMGLQNAAG